MVLAINRFDRSGVHHKRRGGLLLCQAKTCTARRQYAALMFLQNLSLLLGRLREVYGVPERSRLPLSPRNLLDSLVWLPSALCGGSVLFSRAIRMGVAVERAPKVLVAPLVPLAAALAVGVVADRYGGPWGTAGWGTIALLASAGLGAGLWRRPYAPIPAVLVVVMALGGGWHHACWSDLVADDLARSVSEQPRPAWVRGVLRDVLGIYPGDPGLTRAVLEVTGVRDGAYWRSRLGAGTPGHRRHPARPGRGRGGRGGRQPGASGRPAQPGRVRRA